VSIHTGRSLGVALGKCGLHVASSQSLMHFAFREIPDFARHFMHIEPPAAGG
jgi:hypothetical protein